MTSRASYLPSAGSTFPPAVRSRAERLDLRGLVLALAVGLDDGDDVPGVAGAPRWGIPESPPPVRRVRRSWSSLSSSEKTRGRVVPASPAVRAVDRAGWVIFAGMP